MHRIVVLLIVAACSHPAPLKSECPAAPVATPEPAPVTRPSTVISDKALATQAQAFLRAMDTSDAKAFDANAAPTFIWFLYGRTYDRELLLERLPMKKKANAPVPARACKDERIAATASSAVYTAECKEGFAAHDDVPAYVSETYVNLVFVPVNGDWRVSYYSFSASGVDSERDMWNDTFQRGMGFKKTANQHLIDAVKGRKPGKALDIAMGQGRNVLYLASQGWKVTGLDISEAGIKLAKDVAAKQKLTFEAVVQDMDKYDFGKDRWDLVTMIYAGDDAGLIGRVKPSLKKGGLFVVEFFHKETTAGTGIGGFATGALAKQFDGWTILTDQVVEDTADWGLRKSKLVRFTAQKP